MQGPPGTGKSLTIANLTCHLVASGKRVLISAQKDKAMQVVDQELRALNLAQMPMTLLRHDRESKQELRDRLDSIQKTRAAAESAAAKKQAQDQHDNLVQDTESTEHALAVALEEEDHVARADKAVREAPNWLQRLRARANRWSAVRHAHKRAPKMSDELGDRTSRRREELLKGSVHILSSAAEHRTGEARSVRNSCRMASRDFTTASGGRRHIARRPVSFSLPGGDGFS